MDVEKKRQREQETVAKIIEIYCHDHHGKRSGLCPKCEELAHYAEARIAACPRMEVKSFCSVCPICTRGGIRSDSHALRRPARLLHHPLMTLHHDAVVADALRALLFFRRSRQSGRSIKVKWWCPGDIHMV